MLALSEQEIKSTEQNKMTQTVLSPSVREALEWDNGQKNLMQKLGQWVSALQKTLPTNNGTPTALIDAERVAASGMLTELDTYLDQITDPEYNSAKINLLVPVDYFDGFPTIGGLPLWERLEGELFQYYEVFKIYRNMKASRGIRSLSLLSQLTGVELKAIHALKDVYHWKLRIEAYDLQAEREVQMARQRFTRQMENNHRDAAVKIFDACKSYIVDNKEELNAKSALDWLITAVKLERLSLGLNPDKPDDGKTGSPNNVININTAIQNNDNSQTNNVSNPNGQRTTEILAILQQAGVFTLRPQSDEIAQDEKGDNENIIDVVPIEDNSKVIDIKQLSRASQAEEKVKDSSDS
jgi:hypothetical protein